MYPELILRELSSILKVKEKNFANQVTKHITICTISEDSIAPEMDYCEGEIFRVGHTWCQLWATSASGRPRQRGLGNIQSSDIAMGMDLLTIHVSLYLLCHGFNLVIFGGWDFLIW